MDIEYYLKDILPFFNDLNDEEKMKLISKCNINKYKKGEIVHSKNSSCTGLLITLFGNFRGFISSPNGREITLFKLYERCMYAICILRF